MVSFTTHRYFSTTCAIAVLAALICIAAVEAKLLQVHVVFRHGDRTPDGNSDEMYPNDPYLNYDFFPMGRGQLTNAGKQREYALGQFLRARYDHFLGSFYTPASVSALSSDYDRTKMSLQLVLAGLFPPNDLQRWNSRLNWQPIPAKYLRRYEDNVFIPEDCLLYSIEYNRVLESPEGRREIAKFDGLMQQLTKYTGKNISAPIDMYNLYHALTAAKSFGLTLPNWTKNIYPYGELWEGTILSYNISNSTPLLRKLYGGPLLRMIAKNFLGIVTETDTRPVKMNFFSGHESNVAAILFALDVYYPHVPEYSSGILLELHQIDDVYYVKVLHYLGIPSKIVELQLPGCDVLCPLDRYMNFIEDVMPSNEELICDKGRSEAYVDRKTIEEMDLLKYNLIRTAGVIEAK